MYVIISIQLSAVSHQLTLYVYYHLDLLKAKNYESLASKVTESDGFDTKAERRTLTVECLQVICNTIERTIIS
ncbi:MAG: hypothetical protein QNJ37_09665 [Crocosphaera sp.]|nr:hypothetical protein [Crocosphaera sp.]